MTLRRCQRSEDNDLGNAQTDTAGPLDALRGIGPAM